ncbi:BlaI/MecI/CopY family transcriptional regulator [Maricaulis sp. CAU 1757]
MAEADRLSEEENRTLRLLWDRGGASVSELSVALNTRPGDTLDLLRRLRRKGAVDRHHTGRTVLYRPRLNRATARTHALGRLLTGEVPGDGNTGIVVLRESDVDPKDWADLQAEMAARPRRARG